MNHSEHWNLSANDSLFMYDLFNCVGHTRNISGFVHYGDVSISVIVGTLVAIVGTGVLANSVIIYVVISEDVLHRTPFYFLLSIAAMDLIKSIFCVPFVIEAVVHNSTWIYDEETCVLVAFSNSFLTNSTALGLLFIAIDRYLFQTSRRFYNKCTHALVGLIVALIGFIVAFSVAFPPVVEDGSYQFLPEEMQCGLYQRTYEDNETMIYTIVFLFTILAMLFVYGRLFVFMRNHRRMAPLYHRPARSNDWTFLGPGANNQALLNALNGFVGGVPNQLPVNANNVHPNIGRLVNLFPVKNEHITRLFFISSIVFVLTWTLYLVQRFIRVFCDSIALSPGFVLSAVLLSHSHVALCPVCCLLFGSPLRATLFRKAKRFCGGGHEYEQVTAGNHEPREPEIRCIELSV